MIDNQKIPDGWQTLEFDQLAHLNNKKYIPNKNESLKCLELEHFEKGTGRLIAFVDSSLQSSIKNKFKRGDVLFGKLRPYLKKYTLVNFDGVCSTEIWVLSSREICTNKYLYLLVQTDKFNSACNISSGTHMPRADWDYVSKLPLLLPPLAEQEKIADILGCWDTAIEKLTALIDAKKQRKKALMQNLLTAKIRLSGFTDEWKNEKLGAVSDLYQPQTISQDMLLTNGYPVYGANGLIGYYGNYNHETWQIMITCRGSTCGTVNRTNGKSWITGNAMVVNCDNYEVNKLFLYFLLLFDNFASIVSGSGQPQIVKTPLEKWSIYLPSSLPEQQAIADILSKADEEIDLLTKKLSLFQEQKKGLMQKLLTGQIRVKVA